MTTDHAPGGILMRLRRDKRGNVLAISAGALIPLIGFSGSAVDMGRLYLVKVRLQQACDAGVLAGRKVMTDTSMSSSLDSNAKTQAQAFFANNFRAGYLRTSKVAFTPVKAAYGTDSTVANAVTGTATATVPLAVMGMLGAKPQRIDVTCQAVFDLADTDVMFVLDTTGSMACKPEADCTPTTLSEKRSDGSTRYYAQELSGSRIEALRKAVILFDSTMRANADSNTRFRYGFVPYASGVNVGKALYDVSPTYLESGQWTYDTRRLSPDKPVFANAREGDYVYTKVAASSFSYTGVAKSLCVAQRSPAAGFAKSGVFAGTSKSWSDDSYYQARTFYDVSWTNSNGGTCAGTQRTLRAMWRYGAAQWPTTAWVASLVNGTLVPNPTRLDGDSGTWRGCVEEVNTMTGSGVNASNAYDLDPDFKPTSLNRWRPQWPDATWARNSSDDQDVKDESVDEAQYNVAWTNRNYGPDTYYDKGGFAACGMPARRLQQMTAAQVEAYVRDPEFKALGGTYHDVGMIWGARMLSPDGVFAKDTAAWPGRKAPSRNIVFMTDGTLSPNDDIYGLWGVERLANRTGGANSTTGDYANHTARFRAVCDAAKSKGYTIYIVAVGTGVTDDLTYCASPGQTFQASSTDALTAAFKSIAQRVAMLRITQ